MGKLFKKSTETAFPSSEAVMHGIVDNVAAVSKAILNTGV